MIETVHWFASILQLIGHSRICGYYYYYYYCDYYFYYYYTSIQFSLCGSNPYISTEKTNRIYIYIIYIYIQRTTQNTVQATQNTLNTITHINKTPTQNQKTQNIVTCKIYFFCVLTLFR